MEGAKLLQDVKARVWAEIDVRRDDLVGIAETLLHHPECGYREHFGSGFVQDQFRKMGVSYRSGLAVTGVKAELGGSKSGPTVAIMGELDALPLSSHFAADATTGAAHAWGLLASGALEHLAGRVVLFALPAEEFEEIDFRLGLRDEGKLTYLVGKPELIHLGEFDDIDMAIMVHSSSDPKLGALGLWETCNGTIIKRAEYLGRASHAAAAPEAGINALNAALIGMTAINAQRETFRDEDRVRVHPIITKGGEAPNTVPADVQVEMYVRGLRLPAVEEADRKVDRSLRAGALALGAKLRLMTFPGGLPMIQNPIMEAVFQANAVTLVGEENYRRIPAMTGSTDMGDLSWIMPCLHPSAGGSAGSIHGVDFRVTDYNLAVVNPAKAMAMTAVDLLGHDAALARKVTSETKPAMTRAEYRRYLQHMTRDVTYSET
jgi:amidohydrolase